jgi:hypothetical protein
LITPWSCDYGHIKRKWIFWLIFFVLEKCRALQRYYAIFKYGAMPFSDCAAVPAKIQHLVIFEEYTMSMPLQTLVTEGLQLPPHEQDELIVSLLSQCDVDPTDTPEIIAAAWDEEIARRIDAMERGVVAWVDGDEALARLRAVAFCAS